MITMTTMVTMITKLWHYDEEIPDYKINLQATNKVIIARARDFTKC